MYKSINIFQQLLDPKDILIETLDFCQKQSTNFNLIYPERAAYTSIVNFIEKKMHERTTNTKTDN